MVMLKNKIVFITGASSGIGMACAKQFAQAGANLLLCARRLDILNGLSGQLQREYGIDVYAFCLDVRQRIHVMDALIKLPESWKSIDILINNAGFFLPQRAESVDGIEMTLVSQSLRPIQMVVEYYLERQTNQVESNAYGCFAG